jgi:PHD/YefM family antitoxin component YafN of YafNO toxin-antitoxin module
VRQARKGRVVVMRRGKPVAVVLGSGGFDAEQLELCTSPKFWKFIEARRKQKTIPLDELERRLAERDRRAAKA